MNEKTDCVKQLLGRLFWGFPLFFLVDNILGFNGYQFTIMGKSIRMILFCITTALLFGYCVYIVYNQKISLLPCGSNEKTIYRMLKPLDYCVLLFILCNALWATVIPLAVRGEMTYSLKDFSTILVLVLYFPLTFLIRTNKLNFLRLDNIIYGLIICLAGWHVIMYVGDVLKPGFYGSYYDFIDWISFGTAVRTPVVYGFGIVRIIQTTSLFLLPGFFMSLHKVLNGKYIHFLPLALFVFAICTTFTKSIWFGCLCGALLYLVLAPLVSRNRIVFIRAIASIAAIIVLVCGLDMIVFEGSVFQRATNTFTTPDNVDQMRDELDNLWLELYIQKQQAPSTTTSVITTEDISKETDAAMENSSSVENTLSPSETEETPEATTNHSSVENTLSPSETEETPETTTNHSSAEDTLSPSETGKPSEATTSAAPQETEPIDSVIQGLEQQIENKTNAIKDAVGTQAANQTRAEQNRALVEKWSLSKWIGFGYGAYCENLIRNATAPFMYESTLPALLMKVGIVGGLVWIILIMGATITAFIVFWKKNRMDVFWWLGLALSYAMAVQTNSFLFTFAGFSILLYLLISMQN